jgi:hypothetical protein
MIRLPYQVKIGKRKLPSHERPYWAEFAWKPHFAQPAHRPLRFLTAACLLGPSGGF